MLAKLALRNVRRSVRDYAIYFVTLVLGVAVFYAFNSIQSQQVLFDLQSGSTVNIFETTNYVMNVLSGVIACVLGFLVVYANRFLIRRRRHEFGMYLMLGMRPAHVSSIVLLETLIVGVASLVVGLGIGVALSQGLSFVTADLFNVPMRQYRFVFSEDACLFTCLCFAIIFVIVALFNTFAVARCKLIDLLSTRSREERGRVRNPWVSLAGFVAAVGIIALSYHVLIESGLVELGEPFAWATALMLVGTLLLFWSLAGFAVAVIQRTRGVYFKGLAMFTVRQIASRINTAFVSLWAVCVLLFFSITVFSSGMGLVEVFTGNIDKLTRYDATLTAYVYRNTSNVEYYATGEYTGQVTDESGARPSAEEEAYLQATIDENRALAEEARAYGYDIAARLSATNPGWDSFVDGMAQLDVYEPHVEGLGETETYGQLIERLDAPIDDSVASGQTVESAPLVIGVSQYNAVRALAGLEPVQLPGDGYAVNNTFEATKGLSGAMAAEGARITIAGRTLASTGLLEEVDLRVNQLSSETAEVVVPDWLVDELLAAGEAPYASYLNLNYNVGREEGDALLEAALAAALPPAPGESLDPGWGFDTEAWPVTDSFTAAEVVLQSGGLRMLITYLALYIGFVFLITTAAVLAVQQLSEASDSLQRYRVLAELGCDRGMVFGSLLKQVLVYFLAPLAVAVCHAACAVGVLSDSLFAALGVSVGGSALMAAVLVAVVYGGYLLVTYFAARGLVRTSLGKKLLG